MGSESESFLKGPEFLVQTKDVKGNNHGRDHTFPLETVCGEEHQDMKDLDREDHLAERADAIARVVIDDLIDESGAMVRESTGPAHARIQTILERFVLDRLRAGARRLPDDSEEACAFIRGHLIPLRTHLRWFAPSGKKGGIFLKVLDETVFDDGSVRGIESVVRYVAGRSKELAGTCKDLRAEGVRAHYRIVSNHELDASYEVDMIEVVYEVDEQGAPADVRQFGLVQVKSGGFVADEREDRVSEKMERIHTEHRRCLDRLRRYPFDLFVAPERIHEECVQDARVQEEVALLAVGFLDMEGKEDVDAAWGLVEETAERLFPEDQDGHADMSGRVHFYRDIERYISRLDVGSNLACKMLCEAIREKIQVHVAPHTQTPSKKPRGVGRYDIVMALPSQVSSCVYAGAQRVGERNCAVISDSDGMPGLIYRQSKDVKK